MSTHSRITAMLAVCAIAATTGCEKGAKYAEAPEPASSNSASSAPSTTAPSTAGPYGLDFTLNGIDGSPRSLSEFKGKVVMIVNTASQCGMTPQYEGLQRIYDRFKDQGFVILGMPANNFMGQEPGTNEQIAQFCTDKYSVTFPMFEKISVKGDDQHPLFTKLASLPEPLGGDPSWNFTKFLIDKDGRVRARFSPRTKPEDLEVISAIEDMLAGRTPGPAAG